MNFGSLIVGKRLFQSKEFPPKESLSTKTCAVQGPTQVAKAVRPSTKGSRNRLEHLGNNRRCAAKHSFDREIAQEGLLTPRYAFRSRSSTVRAIFVAFRISAASPTMQSNREKVPE